MPPATHGSTPDSALSSQVGASLPARACAEARDVGRLRRVQMKLGPGDDDDAAVWARRRGGSHRVARELAKLLRQTFFALCSLVEMRVHLASEGEMRRKKTRRCWSDGRLSGRFCVVQLQEAVPRR
jgi:hypothetical protein